MGNPGVLLAASERPSPSPDLATPRLGGRTRKKETRGSAPRTSRSARFSWRCSRCLSPSGDLEDLAEAVSSLKFLGKSPSSPKALECLKLCKSTSPRQPVEPGEAHPSARRRQEYRSLLAKRAVLDRSSKTGGPPLPNCLPPSGAGGCPAPVILWARWRGNGAGNIIQPWGRARSPRDELKTDECPASWQGACLQHGLARARSSPTLKEDGFVLAGCWRDSTFGAAAPLAGGSTKTHQSTALTRASSPQMKFSVSVWCVIPRPRSESKRRLPLPLPLLHPAGIPRLPHLGTGH